MPSRDSKRTLHVRRGWPRPSRISHSTRSLQNPLGKEQTKASAPPWPHVRPTKQPRPALVPFLARFLQEEPDACRASCKPARQRTKIRPPAPELYRNRGRAVCGDGRREIRSQNWFSLGSSQYNLTQSRKGAKRLVKTRLPTAYL